MDPKSLRINTCRSASKQTTLTGIVYLSSLAYYRLAVTGLIVLIGFGVFVTNRITTARQKMAAKIGPVWDTEYIGVFDTSIHPHIPVVGQNFVSVTALNGESDRKIDKVSRAGEHRTGIDKMFDSARAFEIRYLLFGEKIGTGTSSEVERGRFSYVLEDSPYHEWLPDSWYSLDSNSLTSRRYPSALILPHLPLNSINLVFRSLMLLTGAEVRYPRVGFGVLQLDLHYIELAVKDSKRENSDYQSGEGEIESSPSPRKSLRFERFKFIVLKNSHKYLFGFVTLIFGLFVSRLSCDLFLGTRASNRWGRWVNRLGFANWGRVYLAVFFLFSSVFLICHGIITLFMPRLGL